jgi:hypothetical protein
MPSDPVTYGTYQTETGDCGVSGIGVGRKYLPGLCCDAVVGMAPSLGG